MLNKKLVGIVLFLALGAAFWAADSLTLDKALETALSNNADLRASAVSVAQAKRNKDAAWNQFLPQITSPTVGVANTHPISPADSTTWAWNSISIGASLSFTADIPTQFKLLDSKYRQAEEAYDAACRNLTASVSISFYSLLAAKTNIQILQTDLALKQAQYGQVKRNYDRGLSSELDLLNAQYAWQIAGPALNDAVSTYDENRAAFLLLIGMDAKTETALEGVIEITTLALPPADSLAAQFLENRSDVKTQAAQAEQARLNAASRINQSLPSIRFAETISLTPERDAGLSFGEGATSGTFSLSLSIPVNPWVPGSSDALRRKDDKDAAALAEAGLETIKKNAAQDIKKKADEIERIAENRESAELNHRITVRAYELSEQGYRSGLVSQTDLQSANQRMVSAEQAVVAAKISYLTAAYNLASALRLDISELYALYAQK
ncbi:MAG: TolC family protein [Treponema sp.]|jgi:multidrug efflux system outer membrane protein|nr:TolC family protein [Treponema sp.]